MVPAISIAISEHDDGLKQETAQSNNLTWMCAEESSDSRADCRNLKQQQSVMNIRF
jgi:hypothetical protein